MNYNQFNQPYDDKSLMNIFKDYMENEKGKTKIVDSNRGAVLFNAAKQLEKIISKELDGAEFYIHFDYIFNAGSICITLDSLEVTNTAAFAEIIKTADNFEIYPLVNGKMEFNILFQRVLKAID